MAAPPPPPSGAKAAAAKGSPASGPTADAGGTATSAKASPATPAAAEVDLVAEAMHPTFGEPESKPLTELIDMGVAAAAQGVLSASEDLWRLPQTVNRWKNGIQQSISDQLPEPLRKANEAIRRALPNPAEAYLELLDKGAVVGGVKVGGTTEWADKIAEGNRILSNDLGIKAFDNLREVAAGFNSATEAALKGDYGPLKEQLKDPKSYAAALGSMAPMLAQTLATGGTNLSVLAVQQALSTSSTAAEFERRTGTKIDDREFAKAATLNAVVNAGMQKLQMKALPAAWKDPVGQVFTQAATSAVAAGGEQVVNNAVTQQYIDPNRKLTEGVAQAGFAGGVGPLATAIPGAVKLAAEGKLKLPQPGLSVAVIDGNTKFSQMESKGIRLEALKDADTVSDIIRASGARSMDDIIRPGDTALVEQLERWYGEREPLPKGVDSTASLDGAIADAFRNNSGKPIGLDDLMRQLGAPVAPRAQDLAAQARQQATEAGAKAPDADALQKAMLQSLNGVSPEALPAAAAAAQGRFEALQKAALDQRSLGSERRPEVVDAVVRSTRSPADMQAILAEPAVKEMIGRGDVDSLRQVLGSNIPAAQIGPRLSQLEAARRAGVSEEEAWKAFASTDVSAFADARMAQLQADPRLHEAFNALEVSPNAGKWAKLLDDKAIAAAVDACAGSLPRSVVAAVNDTQTAKLIPGNLEVARKLHEISGGKLDDQTLARRVAKKTQLTELAANYMSGLGSADALQKAIKTVYPDGLPKDFPEAPFIGKDELLAVIQAAKGS